MSGARGSFAMLFASSVASPLAERTRAHPRWLTRRMLLAVHGAPMGGRHAALVQSALTAPRRLFDREPATDLATLAAAYASGFAHTHGFITGSRRTAFLAAYIFLGLNGYEVDASVPEATSVIRRVADREMSDGELVEWYRRSMVRTR